MNSYVIGLDFGTDSVRALLLDAKDGREMGCAVYSYPRWRQGLYCTPAANIFRQHPLDHIEGMESVLKSVLSLSRVKSEEVVGICIDTTGSSPLPLNEEGIPLALLPHFAENPDAMIVLWKDHSAVAEAAEINSLSASWEERDYRDYAGGVYSSEWFWAKILHIIRKDAAVEKEAYTWMEHCDYMTYLLADQKDLKLFRRSRCAAGHKALWHESWEGLPDSEFLGRLHPYLTGLRGRLYTDTHTSETLAGNLNSHWAGLLGLSTQTVIAVGTFDAHAGAVGARIEPHSLVKVMGTSTCDILIAPEAELAAKKVRGICGQVSGSVLPGWVGLEAGQSAFGDVLAWYRNLLAWPLKNRSGSLEGGDQEHSLLEDLEEKLLEQLCEHAAALPPDEPLPVALDWINGRRSPDADQELKAALSHLSLGNEAPHIFKALVLSICFGSRKIVERFEEEGIRIDTVIGVGGVARKSPYVMQTLANVLNRPLKLVQSDQCPALGAAIYAAVAAGMYPDVMSASKVMGSAYEKTYKPEKHTQIFYEEQYRAYEALGAFIESGKNKHSHENPV